MIEYKTIPYTSHREISQSADSRHGHERSSDQKKHSSPSHHQHNRHLPPAIYRARTPTKPARPAIPASTAPVAAAAPAPASLVLELSVAVLVLLPVRVLLERSTVPQSAIHHHKPQSHRRKILTCPSLRSHTTRLRRHRRHARLSRQIRQSWNKIRLDLIRQTRKPAWSFTCGELRGDLRGDASRIG